MEGFNSSRRSTVYSVKGMVSSTQPLATAAGIKILSQGGNCVDACVAVSACLCVVEPSSTGIGGDCYSLLYKESDKKVYGINGTGRSASRLSIDYLKKNHPDHILPSLRFKDDSIFKIQIPGAIAGWCDAIAAWGSGNVTLSDILAPAIDLAENGFVVSEVSALLWKEAEIKLKAAQNSEKDLSIFLPNDRFEAPIKGQYMRNERLAATMRIISEKGKKGFYEGEIADSIVLELSKRGSLITREDLKNHTSTFVEPISLSILGHKLWEIPPNGSGVIALLTLGLINELDKSGAIDLKNMKHNSSEYIHLLSECLKLSFKDSDEYVNDYEFFAKNHNLDQMKSIENLLSEDYLKSRSSLFKKSNVMRNTDVKHGIPNPMFKSDTVYFTASDSNGDACSFINSVYENFGSGVIIPDRGFALQNRGGNFNLNPTSKNCLEGNKRSYHTIIPGMITTPRNDGQEELYASYGIMGGFNQPQAHVQVYLNMLLFGMDPQQALDAPRICLYPDPKGTDSGFGSDGPASRDATCIGIEDGISSAVVEELRNLGHQAKVFANEKRTLFGRGQIIRRESGPETKGHLVYSAGSDMRGDGAAVPL
ncbi:hypothetical protein HG535_0C00320 [Zygotorulaspora mrakii]|uniref:Gamma-glutamyltransferase n=1 Tax=Zygotorulaspora mrakii TaxID=42260 RepID=A0A7H9B022_ZYGMR|nr:uncharacterized protein HG535_0C00320 [Zygotorulaspora mrakii]QLG71684.1 hypothetical protein HG535_0C00320 [Zygotorulaspora mrakii]